MVWITRFRRKILVKGVKQYLRVKLEEVRKYYPDWEYIEIGIDNDHGHIHIIIPPKYSVSKVVETINEFISFKFFFWD